MANTIPRYLPTTLCNILLLALLIGSSGCIDVGDGCYGGDEYTAYTVDLHVVESDASWQHFSEVRNMEFHSSDQEPAIYSAFDQDSRYSSDGSALALNTLEVRFLHYGVADAPDDSLWQERETVYIYPGYHHFTDTDIYPPRHQVVFPTLIFDTLNNPYTGRSYTRRLIESTLDMQSTLGESPDTLLSYKAAFYDSTKYKSIEVVVPRFDKQGNIIFIAKESRYKITSDSSAQRFYYNLYYQENWLLRLHPDHSLDTLFEFPPILDNNYTNVNDLQYTPHTVAIKVSNSLYIFNSAGKQLFHTDEAGNFMMSTDGSAVTYGNGRYYHRFSDDKQLDLSGIVPDITFAQPYAQQVLVTQKDSALQVVDVNAEKVVQTVTAAQLPPLPHRTGKISTTGIYYPLLTPDHHLRMIYSDSYYIDDPNDPCD